MLVGRSVFGWFDPAWQQQAINLPITVVGIGRSVGAMPSTPRCAV
jgi:hypothetical protein